MRDTGERRDGSRCFTVIVSVWGDEASTGNRHWGRWLLNTANVINPGKFRVVCILPQFSKISNVIYQQPSICTL